MDDLLASRTDVLVVPLRNDDGTMIEEKQLDQQVTQLVGQAKSEGAIVLLHVVPHSKTGMHAPSLECIAKLRRQYADLVVMVDAA